MLSPTPSVSPKHGSQDDRSSLDFGLVGSLDATESAEASPQSVSDLMQAEFRTPVAERWTWFSLPAWLVSMLVHIAILLFMAAYHVPAIGEAIDSLVMSAVPTDDTSEVLEEFAIDSQQTVEVTQEMSESIPDSAPALNTPMSEVAMDVHLEGLTTQNLVGLSLPSTNVDALTSAMLASGSAHMTKGLTSRSKVAKRDLLERYGGNKDTEKAVAAALKFLADHQMKDGSWTFAHSIACNGKCKDPGKASLAQPGATGLVLMAFLGAGQNHLEGEYKKTVYDGLAFLIRSMRTVDAPIPSWYYSADQLQTGAMYSHGIAAIAMCEAYGMTKDPELKEAAQLSLDFICYAQSPTGGWHYAAKGPSADTSVVGWQLMALKSGSMSGLGFPQKTLVGARRYLDSVQNKEGTIYGYERPNDRDKIANAMTACAILCRMYMGMPKNSPELKTISTAFLEQGPIPDDIYYNYYATQVIKQIGGETWEEWNKKMLAFILPTQETSGHMAGSWMEGRGSHSGDYGGRLYVTAMSTMILEVYYRYMPLYGDQSEEEAFKL